MVYLEVCFIFKCLQIFLLSFCVIEFSFESIMVRKYILYDLNSKVCFMTQDTAFSECPMCVKQVCVLSCGGGSADVQ